MQELWLHHNNVPQLSCLSPVSALPSLTALFLSPSPLCAALKTDYRAAVVYTLSSLQVSCCSAVTCTYSAAVATLHPRCILIHTGQVVYAAAVTWLAAAASQDPWCMLLLAGQVLFLAGQVVPALAVTCGAAANTAIKIHPILQGIGCIIAP